MTTLFGRKVHVRGIHSKNASERNFSERAAINAPLQGTAADIIKRAMVEVFALVNSQPSIARLLLQVHDELVLEVAADHAQDVAQKVRRIMEQAAHLTVPLVVDVGIGQHWGEIH